MRKVPAVVFATALVLLVGSIVWTAAGAGSLGSRDSGHYTLEKFRGSRPAGMMSVNESTGSICYQRWHGRFGSIIE